MFVFGKREIQLIEYDCSSVRTKGARLKKIGNKGKLTISSIRLSVAMARTIMSKNPTQLDLNFHFLSSFFNIQSMIDSRKKNLRLSINTRHKLRDFSLTGRIGELAQAVNFIFAQDVLKSPIVVDFEGYISSFNNISNYTGEAPDFIISKIGNSTISILESKGSHPNSPNKNLKTSLREGLEQCENAKNFIVNNNIAININQTFAAGAWFADVQSPWDTTIGYSDPIEYREEVEFDDLALMRYHYASWFSIIGLFNYSLQLISNEPLFFERPTEVYEYENERFYLFDSNWSPYMYNEISLFSHFGFYSFVKFGIAEKVWNILTGNELNLKNSDIQFVSLSEEGIEIFSDGTLVLYDI